MKRLFLLLAFCSLSFAFSLPAFGGTCVGNTGAQACNNPTPNLGLCRPNYLDDPVDLAINCNWNEIDKKFASTTGSGGHAHTGAAGEGPTLGTSSLSFDPATQAELDTHKTSADHDARYLLKAGDTATGVIKLPDGTSALPSLTWANEAGNDTGFYYGGTSGRIIYTRNAQKLLGFGGNGLNFPSAYGVHWTANANDPEATPDTSVWRDTVGQIGQRISSTGTTKKPMAYALYNLYGTDTTPTSTEAIVFGWNASNKAAIETQFAGTNGVARDLYVGPTGSACYFVQSNGAAVWKACAAGDWLPAVDNAVKVGDGTLDPLSVSSHEYALNGGSGSFSKKVTKTQAITLTGASTASTITVPRYATLRSAAQRITTAITGAGVTSYTLKMTNDATQCQNGTTGITVNLTNPGTACFGKINNHTGADTITITAVGGTFTGGVVRIIVTYDEVIPPTS
jgi:hypothetical protein